jgi:hypothetical protein
MSAYVCARCKAPSRYQESKCPKCEREGSVVRVPYRRLKIFGVIVAVLVFLMYQDIEHGIDLKNDQNFAGSYCNEQIGMKNKGTTAGSQVYEYCYDATLAAIEKDHYIHVPILNP